MALTNDQITAQNFKAFYDQIKPYLGGMPEMVANKFSKGDLYSTDEKMIGQWIDGKPIYQKVFTGTSGSDGADKTIGPLSNVDTLVALYGEATNGSGMKMGAPNAGIYFKYSSGNIQTYTVSSSGFANSACIIIAQYTKTTDSAIAMGIDTDYSTTEKIVGTWIDGKPLYQKTIVMSSWSEAHNITNLGDLVSCEGALKSGSSFYVIPYVSDNNAGYRMTFVVSSTNVEVQHGSGWNFDTVNVTLRYTKSSD